MSVEGIWDLTISTPIGRLTAVVELHDNGGALTGTAHGQGEQVPLQQVALVGDQLTWKQAITKPMRLNLAFAVIIDGDSLSGTAKAGRLPSSKVTGQRRAAAPTTAARGRAGLGPVGVVLGIGDWADSLAAAPELEELGYSTIWLPGPQLDNLERIRAVARVTRSVLVSTVVIVADKFSAEEVAQIYHTMEAEHPGRFIAGLGGAHGPRPLRTLGAYLDRLDTGPTPVPVRSRLLSALGPRMLDLAGQRTAGAVPILATPEYTKQTRARLGPGATLVVEQFVALDTDRARARDAARGMIRYLRDVEGGYSRHFKRMGFADGEITQLADRFVEALVACGDVDSVVRRVGEPHAAGADQVALMTIPTGGASAPRQQWQQLSEALIS